MVLLCLIMVKNVRQLIEINGVTIQYYPNLQQVLKKTGPSI